MFKLIESLFVDPIHFPVKPGVSVSPGHVVSIVEYKDNLVIDLCDGSAPFGLVGNRCFGGNVVDFRQMANVYPQRMIVDLNRFDRESDIKVGSSLYCNEYGVLSSRQPFEGALLLAKVITPAGSKKNYMQILWL
jgi:hypothetical protein